MFTEQQVQSLAPNAAAFQAGKKLSGKEQWQSYGKSDRAIWGAIKGSGTNPYLTQIDTVTLAYKCTCPSRQFPCKHSIALMLLHANSNSTFTSQEEPEWVKAWLDKRVVKEKPQAEQAKVRTEEEVVQLEKSREKTQQNRLASVQAGASELELWLKDLVRIGLLELPNKNQSEFERVAARMVDAKAPGLAGWVKAFSRLNYYDRHQWQSEAMVIMAKLYLLVLAIKNYQNLSPEWQQTVKTLSGWSQSPKDLLTDNDALAIKDQWLVAGQETEITDDEITIQRNWVIGCNSNRQGLILNFGTRFSAIESTIVPGTVVDAELAYFNSVWPQRCIFRQVTRTSYTINSMPAGFDSLNMMQQYRARELSVYPWLNDLIVILKNARLMKHSEEWLLCDQEKNFLKVSPFVDEGKVMQWLAISGNRKLDMAIVVRNNYAVPMGVFVGNEYKLL